MSGEAAPLAGSGVDTSARPEDGDRASEPARRYVPLAEPSLAHVIATTLRLWLRRRVLRVADGASVGALRWTAVAAVIVVLMSAAAGGVAAGLHSHHAAPRPHRHMRGQAPSPVSSAQAATTANEQAAVAWIMSQVAPGTAVACDQGMCGQLQSAGFPANELGELTPALATPSGSRPALVVSTPATRAAAGSDLALSAPQIIASFGSGSQQVQVRVRGSQTPAAFRTAAQAAIAAAKRSGRNLARNPRLHLLGQSRRELLSGLVDPRLLVVLGKLLAAHRMYLTGFSDGAPGGWPDELRAVTVVHLFRRVGEHKVSDLGAVLRLIRKQRDSYRPVLREVHQASGAITLTIQFPAPSPV